MKTLIVGAGPVGMTLALALRTHGVEVEIIDKRGELSTLPRAIAINQATLRALARLGVMPAVNRIGRRADRLCLYRGRNLITELGFHRLALEEPCFFYVRQAAVERILAARLDEIGVSIRLGEQLTALHRDGDNASARLTHVSGATREITAHLLIACDGGASFCRELAGIGVDQTAYGGHFCLADMDVEIAALCSDHAHCFLGRDGYLLLLPAPDGATRLVASFRTQISRPLDALGATFFMSLLDARAGVRARVERLIWVTQANFGHRLALAARRGAFLLAGDALHQFSPIGGTNMNFGIQDALLLADAVASGRLDDYEPNRLSAMRQQMEMTRYLTWLMVRPLGMKRPVRAFTSGTFADLFADELPRRFTGLAELQSDLPDPGSRHVAPHSETMRLPQA